ncbi:DUF1257 domain-containing protein [Gloeobacter kilaueensis]|uniref:Ycf35 n=1 Tax=Gloeobacter kilaueensis (strain ATCC BAA-2537 / CCAP 1431/1 / ULC 316 / JS1) TaxID=1183438 RepID=U5QK80_GLOK1|nr:DUF1257 domain-containing protein [Gloeobacter kilaueensis]AGY59301.1 Ycf35 [Gloeobacter kilaueensis JS1]
MSHFTTVRLQLKNRAVLRTTLEQLGHTVSENAPVRGYRGNSTRADLVVHRQNGYDIGFYQKGEALEMVADFWGVGLTAEQFLAPVQQRYAHNLLLATAAEQGFSVESEEVSGTGELRVVLGRWA